MKINYIVNYTLIKQEIKDNGIVKDHPVKLHNVAGLLTEEKAVEIFKSMVGALKKEK